MSNLIWLSLAQMRLIEPPKNGVVPRPLGRTKGGLSSRRHAVCEGKGRPLIMLLSEGQMSHFKGAALMIDAFPKAKSLLGDTCMQSRFCERDVQDRGLRSGADNLIFLE